MSAPGATLGPWITEVHEKYSSISVVAKRGDGDVRSSDGMGELFRVECAVDCEAHSFSPMQQELVAVAHLAAASPALYDALERALNFIENTEGELGEPLGCGDAARAALALARGEAA